MKRILCLVLMLCLLMASACAGETILTSQMEKDDIYQNIHDMATVGDTLYVLTSYGVNARLYRWKKGLAGAETVAENLVYGWGYLSVSDLERDYPGLEVKGNSDPKHAMSELFTDGEKLYGFNAATNLVFEIEVTADGLRYTDVATLPRERAQSEYAAISVNKVDKWLLWMELDPNSRKYNQRLLVYDLENGTVKQAVLPGLQAVTSYQDTQVLAICKTDEQDKAWSVYAYAPANDACTLLGILPTGTTLSTAAYSEEMDLLIYQKQTSVMGWHPDTGEERLGFVPDSYSACMIALGEQAISNTGNQVIVSSIGQGYTPEHSVTVMNGIVDVAGKAFLAKYPDVPFFYGSFSGESFTQLLRRTKDAPDLLRLSSEDHPEALAAEGLLADLSVYPDIKAYVDVLYPPYKELVTEGDAIYAVPVFASAYNGWFINKEVMNAMGFTAEDIPTSLTELCAFATKWNDELAEKYPHYTLLNNTTSYRERLLEAIVDAWRDYCAFTGKDLNYDDPIFREALVALDAARLDKLDAALRQTNPEVSEYKQALIWTGCKTVGNFKTYMEDFSDRIFIPLTLTPDTPYTCDVRNVSLWTVNAASTNKDYAAAMLSEIIAGMDDTSAYVLRSDRTEPVMEDYAEDVLSAEREALAELEAKLEESVNRAAIEKRIEERKTYIEDQLMPQLYNIVPSALENYVKVIVPATFIGRMSDVYGEDYATVEDYMADYAEGKCTADEFITRMNEWLKN
ncbi:MAG: ABC transporter substrate-binding protein [Clostridiales bacterium]|nr:ABC transporter substrate-binding protein [Clostridiales bacterium]